jgi:hypothetical protein
MVGIELLYIDTRMVEGIIDELSSTISVLNNLFVGKGGLEPPRLAAHDPKSCLSANSSTSPARTNYKRKEVASQ